MDSSIIQWNCRGLRNKYEEIQIFIKDYNPIAICLQETFVPENVSVTFSNYSIYSFPAVVVNDKANGGSTIIVRNDIAHNEVQLNSSLQACAVTLSLHKKVTLCCVYFPPSLVLDCREVDLLVAQLPGHIFYWGTLMPTIFYGVVEPPTIEVMSLRVS